MAAINPDVFLAHTPIRLGYLRNGPAGDVARTARESAIAPKYFFHGIRYRPTIRGNAANRIPPCPTVVLFEAQWRTAFSVLVEASVEDARSAHAAAAAAVGDAFDEAGARAAAAALPATRTEAIGLGAVHTTLVESYAITGAGLRETETGPRKLALVDPGPAVDDAAYRAALRSATGGWNVVLASGNDEGVADPDELVMLNVAALSEEEIELAFAIMAMGQAAPVRAGAQLFEDGHHYHSDSDGSARHKAIEREVIGKVTGPARNLWRAAVMPLRNVVWHASIHAVRVELLQTFAEDDDMPARLDATGYGSMSVGLPAQEDLFRRAGSYTAVLNQVSQTATAHGHTLDLSNMTATVAALATLPRRGALPAQRPALPDQPAAAWPAGCNTRAKALKLFLEPALDKAEPVAAWMFGFYREICSRGGIRANSQEGSLLRSYSLKRAVGNYLGEANRAQEMYSARARYIRTQAEEGKLESYHGSA